MSFLSEKFHQLKDAAHRALEFADPEAALRQAEHDFKAALVEGYHDLQDRIEALENRIVTLISPQSLAPTQPVAAVPVEAAPAKATPLEDATMADVGGVSGDPAPAAAESAQPAA